MFVTVIATDDGSPPLFDVCTFKITINDINDNPPLFDKSFYLESIPEDLPEKREVMRIYATDSDAGLNSEIVYSLDSSKYNDEINYADFFAIDDATGKWF